MQKVLNRLDAIEKQNRDLLEEIQNLKEQLRTQSSASVQADADSDREALNEQRVRELAQTKVEASARYPVSLTGMVLFDAFNITGTKNSLYQSTYSDYSLGSPGGGATFNQSIIGLRFTGPQLPAGGHTNAFLSMDFYAGSKTYQTFRLRRAGASFDWLRRSITVAKDKPLISPFEPLSYARVGVPGLAGAGNLWLWLPQIRYDERLHLGSRLQGTFSAALLETNESYGYLETVLPNRNRPALESRFELKQTSDARTVWSGALGAHVSESHVDGRSVPSRVLSADFRFSPVRWLDLSGTILTGENFANLGAIGPGVSEIGSVAVPVKSSAGWLQLSFPVTRRLTLDVYGGRQVNRAQDLLPFQIVRTFDVAGNALYRVTPNIVLGFEAARNYARYLNGLDISGERFDVTLAYLF